MTGTFIVNGTNTTIDFAWTQTTTKTQNIVGVAAHYLANQKGVDFATLTNQQKLNLVDAHLRQVIIDLARTYNANAAADTARDAAIVDADANLTLP